MSIQETLLESISALLNFEFVSTNLEKQCSYLREVAVHGTCNLILSTECMRDVNGRWYKKWREHNYFASFMFSKKVV